MNNRNRENVDLLLESGFNISFATMNQNTSLHWHVALEILYILNGSATVHIDQEEHHLNPLDVIVIDSSKIHDAIYALPHTMGINIHISKNFMRKYIPNLELLRIECNPEDLLPDKLEAHIQLCEYLKELTILYVNQPVTYELKSNALVLEILACLIENFSIPMTETLSIKNIKNIDRMNQIEKYVEEHYKESITLQDAANELGLNKEYFCRFFKQNTGISFITYLNQVRINHIYSDLIHTEDSTSEILERHGFLNQKLFYKMFKEIYDCTPRELRTLTKDNPFI
ncbi:two-component response regulator TrxR [Lachnospiraceae bacterium KM106-2]|nr:two-component response regulator TrxR [Lachnospiraceae bacterium KM106-2]